MKNNKPVTLNIFKMSGDNMWLPVCIYRYTILIYLNYNIITWSKDNKEKKNQLKLFVNLHKTLAVHQPKKNAEETRDPNYWAIQKVLMFHTCITQETYCNAYKRCVVKHETKFFVSYNTIIADIVCIANKNINCLHTPMIGICAGILFNNMF